MERQESNFKFLVGKLSAAVLLTVCGILLLGILVLGTLLYLNKDNRLAVEEEARIGLTPTQIKSIENIGQWEFLSISDEELIDTVRHGFFSDDELVRIYYGTLRLGIDLSEAREGWLRAEGDSATAVLPPVKLLDEAFIDEARTRSFFESGTWTATDREALYQRAYRAMRQRCLNETNLKSARQNAANQFRSLLRSMGFERVNIRFEKTPTTLQP